MKNGTLNNMYWLVKREFWEHRGGFLWAPVITGGIFLLLNLMGIITAEVFGASRGIQIGNAGGLKVIINKMDAGDLDKVGLMLDLSMYSAMSMIAIVMGFVVMFYCLGALYDDRRDRSILFWKSLPVSDLSTVLSKVISATVLAPLIAIIVSVLAGIAQLLMMAITLSFHGVNLWHLLAQAHPFRVIANMIGHLPLYLLFALPSVGWFLLCSAWARTKPFLWAVTLPVLAGTLVSWFDLMGPLDLSSNWFWRHVILRMLVSVFPGSNLVYGSSKLTADGDNPLAFVDLAQTYRILTLPEMWIGVAIGAALIAAAVWFRRWRDDS